MLKQLLKGKDKDLSRGNNPFAAHDDGGDSDEVSTLSCTAI